MSKRVSELTLRELRAGQAVVRGEAADTADFAELMGVSRPTIERLLQPGIHTPAMRLAVLVRMISRLLGADASRDDIGEAFAVHRLLEARKVAAPASDLTMDEMRAAQALLRGQDPDIGAASALLSWSPGTVRHFLVMASNSRALDGMLTVTLLLRLRGRRVGLAEMADAFLTVLGKEVAELLREVAH